MNMKASQSHRTVEPLVTKTFTTSTRCTEDASDTASEYSDRYTNNHSTHSSTSTQSSSSSHPQGEAFAVENSNLLRDLMEELNFERARRIQLEMELSERPSRTTASTTSRNTQEQSACSSIDHQSHNGQEDLVRSQHYLQIAFEINSIYSNGENIPKRLLYPILIKFFNKLYDNTIKDTYGTDISNKVCPDAIKKGKDKRIKDAINRVYSECDTSMASKIMRVEYEQAVLKPALEMVSFDFVNKLISDTSTSESSPQPNQQIHQAAYNKNVELESQLDRVKLANERNVKKLTTERDAYLSLLDSLTSDNDAIVLASENPGFTLPLHQVRFLEIMPWDDRAQDFISVTEEITQWQAFDLRTVMWTDKKIITDPFFQHLPLDKKGTTSRINSPVGKIQHAFDSFGLNGRILTDAACGHVLDLTDGYSLPKNGTWEWVSNWTLSDNKGSGSTAFASPEEEGWIYSETLEALLPSGGDLGAQCKEQTGSRFRKKTWQRRRVLISYPGISPGTRQMLKMNAHNAKLTLAVSKLHDQVHSMQNKLIQKDEELDRTTMSLMSQISATEDELDAKNQTIQSLRVQLFKTTRINSTPPASAKSLEKKSKPLLNLCDSPSSTKTKATNSTRTLQSSDSECAVECEDLVDMDISIESIGWLKSLETMRSNVQTAMVSSKVI
jgi:hypothetical protein